MVAADMPASSAAVSSSTSSSPNRRRIATNSDSIGTSRLPVGIPTVAQQKTSPATTFGPYFGGRGARSPCGGRDATRDNLGVRWTKNEMLFPNDWTSIARLIDTRRRA
jgi:hypothetical protein